MSRMAGELADGIHVHPFHSPTYLEHRLIPAVAKGAARAGRDPAAVDLIVPVFAIGGDTPEERALAHRHGPAARSPSTAARRTTPSSSTTSASRARRHG